MLGFFSKIDSLSYTSKRRRTKKKKEIKKMFGSYLHVCSYEGNIYPQDKKYKVM